MYVTSTQQLEMKRNIQIFRKRHASIKICFKFAVFIKIYYPPWSLFPTDTTSQALRHSNLYFHAKYLNEFHPLVFPFQTFTTKKGHTTFTEFKCPGASQVAMFSFCFNLEVYMPKHLYTLHTAGLISVKIIIEALPIVNTWPKSDSISRINNILLQIYNIFCTSLIWN